MLMGRSGFSDDAGIHEGEDAIEFSYPRKLSSFRFAEGLVFMLFKEGFEADLEIVGEFEQAEPAYLLDLDAGVNPR